MRCSISARKARSLTASYPNPCARIPNTSKCAPAACLRCGRQGRPPRRFLQRPTTSACAASRRWKVLGRSRQPVPFLAALSALNQREQAFSQRCAGPVRCEIAILRHRALGLLRLRMFNFGKPKTAGDWLVHIAGAIVALFLVWWMLRVYVF